MDFSRLLQKYGEVAYKLKLPPHSRVHPIFHVSLLKKAIGEYNVQVDLSNGLEVILEDEVEPEYVIASRHIVHNGEVIRQWLVKWKAKDMIDTMWEDDFTLRTQFPHFSLEDKDRVVAGGNDRNPQDVFDLPFHMARDQIEESLWTKMSSIKARMTQLQDEQKEAEVTCEATEKELELEAQLVEASSIIQEQVKIFFQSYCFFGVPASIMSKHFAKTDKPRRLSSHFDAASAEANEDTHFEERKKAYLQSSDFITPITNIFINSIKFMAKEGVEQLKELKLLVADPPSTFPDTRRIVKNRPLDFFPQLL
ncbi:hypothetical protein ZIOFF_020893 [Zingiber officinale]|uniref:Tf2-1-like SH3-like domain-containing protein n=1 Tax=Zingiber officinale TaxID=94328 RepID=A0A8J5L854_ZINOF|nr:hypothetical protein ZIOFF_020893 [Zingiber officinale]